MMELEYKLRQSESSNHSADVNFLMNLDTHYTHYAPPVPVLFPGSSELKYTHAMLKNSLPNTHSESDLNTSLFFSLKNTEVNYCIHVGES